MTVPNLLTLSRILLTFLLIWFLEHRRLNHALVVFFIAGMTDALDGFNARLYEQKSRLGAIMDPLADKFLLVSSLLILGHMGLIPGWLVGIAVVRDIVIVTGTTLLFLIRCPLEIFPTRLGKFTTLMQLMAVLVALSTSLIDVDAWPRLALNGVAAVSSFASGAQYVRKGVFCLLEDR